MGKIMKTVVKAYFLTDFEAEEVWLHDMYAEGWKLHANPFPYLYQFERTEPRDVTFRLEFHPEKKDRDAYLSMVHDYGWSSLLGQNGWIVFWKETDSNPSENEIFSDDASRWKMIVETAEKRFVPCLLLTLLLIADEMLIIMNYPDRAELLFVTVILLAVLCLDFHLIRGYLGIRRKLSV